MRDRIARGETLRGDRQLYGAARSYFGSVGAAGAAAGVKVRRFRSWTRDSTLEALRELARHHVIVAWRRIPRTGIRRAIRVHFGSLAKACRAAGVTSAGQLREEQHGIYDDSKQVLAHLRAIAAKLDRPVVRRDLPWSLSEALARHFGSLGAARDAARLPHPAPPNVKWTVERVVDQLRREHRRGTRITAGGLAAAGRLDLVGAIKKHVGSVPRARRLARVSYAPTRDHVPFVQVWDADLVIAALEDRIASGESLAGSRVPPRLFAAAIRYHGSWRGAITAAGLDYDAVRLVQRATDEQLLAMVRQLARARPGMTLVELRTLPIGPRLYARFGGAEAAAMRVGISGWPVRRLHRPLDAESIRRILRARIQLRKPITRTAIKAVYPELVYSITRIHPTWGQALARLGFGERATRQTTAARLSAVRMRSR